MIQVLDISIWAVVKGFILVALFLYLIFSFVVIKQIKLMTDTLAVGLEAQLKFFAYLHLAFAILVFLTALIVL